MVSSVYPRQTEKSETYPGIGGGRTVTGGGSENLGANNFPGGFSNSILHALIHENGIIQRRVCEGWPSTREDKSRSCTDAEKNERAGRYVERNDSISVCSMARGIREYSTGVNNFDLWDLRTEN